MMYRNIPEFLVALQEILYSKFLKITFSCNFLFPFLLLDTWEWIGGHELTL